MDRGVIDSDYEVNVDIIMCNHHPDKFYSIRTGYRIAQIVFMRKLNVKFEEVSEPALLGRRKRGSTGTSKMIKKEPEKNQSEDDNVII